MEKRTILLSVLTFFIFGTAFAQKIPSKDVPSVVLNNFQTKFRNAEDVEWKHKNNYYEVEFEINHRDYEIKYNPKGGVISYEEELDVNTVPSNIQSAIKTKYPNSTVREAEKKEKNGLTYKVGIKDAAGEKWDIVLDQAGKIISEKRD
ncbi:PepSY-like domain-containing protein [Chitinophaga rhizophila]|uniref:PepSY-like domain-containing protein n=1 Tax=Chitinophaga rhizophila TaxID=2866212 RepID=A0ABS7G7H5_9BACT|nr:PepSY-like domain-containing protein [Chitinophaga rhizophila]MBW8683590.1 PepSY-like domain-containing protein [Chitinophaga rhizophila]